MSKIDIDRNKRIEEIDKEFYIAAQKAPAYDPLSPKGGKAWKEWANLCRGFEADLAKEGVELF